MAKDVATPPRGTPREFQFGTDLHWSQRSISPLLGDSARLFGASLGHPPAARDRWRARPQRRAGRPGARLGFLPRPGSRPGAGRDAGPGGPSSRPRYAGPIPSSTSSRPKVCPSPGRTGTRPTGRPTTASSASSAPAASRCATSTAIGPPTAGSTTGSPCPGGSGFPWPPPTIGRSCTSSLMPPVIPSASTGPPCTRLGKRASTPRARPGRIARRDQRPAHRRPGGRGPCPTPRGRLPSALGPDDRSRSLGTPASCPRRPADE